MAKHRGRSGSSFIRKKPKIQLTGDRILIVCEGEKTEPGYFKGLRKQWKIHAAQIEIAGKECGSAPISVVDYAIRCKKQAEKNTRRGDALRFDQVWCVFDCDHHHTYKEALQKANDNKLFVAASVPCFEFWYLMHFIYTTKPFNRCEEIIRELNQPDRLPGYDKAQAQFDRLDPYLEQALEHCEHLREDHRKTGSDCPATDVDILVNELMALKPVH
ncbi:MAG: RloB domain-containing protein [Candidatus Omnitrophica bacterium]|nr:RloB domain-containing protein [Candidatus Omnitrophota bacterium]